MSHDPEEIKGVAQAIVALMAEAGRGGERFTSLDAWMEALHEEGIADEEHPVPFLSLQISRAEHERRRRASEEADKAAEVARRRHLFDDEDAKRTAIAHNLSDEAWLRIARRRLDRRQRP